MTGRICHHIVVDSTMYEGGNYFLCMIFHFLVTILCENLSFHPLLRRRSRSSSYDSRDKDWQYSRDRDWDRRRLSRSRSHSRDGFDRDWDREKDRNRDRDWDRSRDRDREWDREKDRKTKKQIIHF